MPEILKEIAGTELLNHKIPLHVPPAAFTRFDRPVEYKYKPEPQSKRGCLAQKGEDLDPERYIHVQNEVQNNHITCMINFLPTLHFV